MILEIVESETGLTGLMDDWDMEDVNDCNYETDCDVEILDGFHLENTLYQVNDKVQRFAFYWMKL